jgi:hypothetical protein
MVDLASTAMEALAESATGLTSGIAQNVPMIGKDALGADSL